MAGIDMNYPLFHVGEAVRVGPEAYDRRMIGRVCKVESIKAPVQGELRYLISTESGLASIVLQSTLRKHYQPGDIATIWRPNRISR